MKIAFTYWSVGGGGKYVSFCWLQFLAYAINITEFLSILDQMADP